MAKKALKKGIFITFEGPEGSGKSTHVRLLCSYLRKRQLKALHLREPGATVIGEKIREILLNPKNKKMDIVCEMLLYQAARAQVVAEKILPALRKKKVVILDRFLDATVCYQGCGAGLNINMIKQIGALVTSGLKPDLTILLDISAKSGLDRSRRRDRIEKRPLEFHRRVRKGYLNLARKNAHRIKIVRVHKDMAETQAAIRKIVAKTFALKELFPSR